MNIALRFSGSFDAWADTPLPLLLIPVGCILLFAGIATAWICTNGLRGYLGLCKFRGNKKAFLWFIPLLLISCGNLGGVFTGVSPASILMAIYMAAVGYTEELLFRGFLFRSLAKGNMKFAIFLASLTFGAGHLLNLTTGGELYSTLLQFAYATAIGFLYTVICWRGGSLIPCMLSHSFFNASSVFFTQSDNFFITLAVILLSLSYGLRIWKQGGLQNAQTSSTPG